MRNCSARRFRHVGSVIPHNADCETDNTAAAEQWQAITTIIGTVRIFLLFLSRVSIQQGRRKSLRREILIFRSVLVVVIQIARGAVEGRIWMSSWEDVMRMSNGFAGFLRHNFA